MYLFHSCLCLIKSFAIVELSDVAGEVSVQGGDFTFLNSTFSCSSLYPIMLLISCSVLLFSSFLLGKFSVMVSSFHVYNSFSWYIKNL